MELTELLVVTQLDRWIYFAKTQMAGIPQDEQLNVYEKKVTWSTVNQLRSTIETKYTCDEVFDVLLASFGNRVCLCVTLMRRRSEPDFTHYICSLSLSLSLSPSFPLALVLFRLDSCWSKVSRPDFPGTTRPSSKRPTAFRSSRLTMTASWRCNSETSRFRGLSLQDLPLSSRTTGGY